MAWHRATPPFRHNPVLPVPASPQIAHIGIAVPSIAAALPFYHDVLGLEPGPPEEADGSRIVSLGLGGSAVELLERYL